MENAVHEPQHVLVLGGTSDIGVAIARRVMSPNTTYVGLACRRPESAAGAVESLTRPGTVVEALEFDATRVEDHRDFVDRVVAEHGDLDVVVLAFGQLGDQERFDDDPTSAAAVVDVNYTSAVAIGLEIARRFRVQGHGTLVVLSSVAGERARKSNFVYGSSKAALDAFAQGLGDSLEGSGARVLVVRPGFVHSAMTAGMKPAPFATTPDAVADVSCGRRESSGGCSWCYGTCRIRYGGDCLWVESLTRSSRVAVARGRARAVGAGRNRSANLDGVVDGPVVRRVVRADAVTVLTPLINARQIDLVRPAQAELLFHDLIRNVGAEDDRVVRFDPLAPKTREDEPIGARHVVGQAGTLAIGETRIHLD
ncbi:MAG: hypothetical protein RLZ86_1939, partial [Actinomycetota bacterium]